MNTKSHSQGQLHSKLAGLRPQIVTRPGKNRGERTTAMPPVHSWVKDGEDHINLWEEGATELGRILSHRCELVFDHNHLGRFKTMEALDIYVMSAERNDKVRNLTGPALKKFRAQQTAVQIKNFRAIIMDSNWQRIKQYPDLAEAVKNSTLPFDVYYVLRDSALRVRPTRFDWLIPGFEEIRKALKEDREPNFDFLIEVKGSKIYDFIHRKQPAPKSTPAVEPKKEQKSDAKGGKDRNKQALTRKADAVPAAAPAPAAEVETAAAPAEQIIVDAATAAAVSAQVETPAEVEAPAAMTGGVLIDNSAAEVGVTHAG